MTQKNGKSSFGLNRKSPKFEKYTDFKLHLTHIIVHVTAKIRCGAAIVLAKL